MLLNSLSTFVGEHHRRFTPSVRWLLECRYDALTLSRQIAIKPSAVREIETIPQKKVRQRVVKRIEALAGEPWPPGCEKFTGHDRYRVRQGPYRIV